MRRLQSPQNILPRAVAWINEATTMKSFEGASVMLLTFTLRIGCKHATYIGTLRPRQSKPAQILQHCGNEFGPAARAVQIFISEDQRATAGPCPFLRDPESPRMT